VRRWINNDAILVTDEEKRVVDFATIIDIRRIPRQVFKGGTLPDVRELASRALRTPKHFSPESQKLPAADRRVSTYWS
jgi:hypothetical protein